MYKAEQGSLSFFFFLKFFSFSPSILEQALAMSNRVEFCLAHLSSVHCQKQLEEMTETVYGLWRSSLAVCQKQVELAGCSASSSGWVHTSSSSPSLLLSRGDSPVSDKGLRTEKLAFVIPRLMLERILNSKTIHLVQNMVFLCWAAFMLHVLPVLVLTFTSVQE